MQVFPGGSDQECQAGTCSTLVEVSRDAASLRWFAVTGCAHIACWLLVGFRPLPKRPCVLASSSREARPGHFTPPACLARSGRCRRTCSSSAPASHPKRTQRALRGQRSRLAAMAGEQAVGWGKKFEVALTAPPQEALRAISCHAACISACPADTFAPVRFRCRTPYILVDSTADVSVGLKLWGAYLPPLEPPSGFIVEFEVVHSENAHWSTGVLAGLVWSACMHRCWGLCTCRVHISPQVCLPVCISGLHIGRLVACTHVHSRGCPRPACLQGSWPAAF